MIIYKIWKINMTNEELLKWIKIKYLYKITWILIVSSDCKY